jgi:hypothetical protein
VRRGVLVVATALAVACGSGRADEIDYRGERIKLSKAYADYASYKNDPDNIHPSERERVQRLVKTAPVASSYADENTLYHALSALSFPGYGSGNLARTRQPDGSDVVAYGIEIPGTEEDRYLVFRSVGSGFALIDDFVHVSVIGPASIAGEGHEWVYRRADGTVLFRRSKRTG